ncbi:MAG: Eco57I restriction-modification methylase domain-containing protein [Candidatus Poribacteria bacterium]|nr:Eco57I restriction-modification methylase domain-containing protein [Candidatus Poribacteria bacterium]
MPLPQNTRNIYKCLKNFQGIESLRELFWIELNYNRDNTPIENLPDSAANLVAENPLLFATAGLNKDFHIIYVKLNNEKLLKTEERQIITHLQTRFPDALYVFSNSVQEQWHFINVKITREQQKETEQQDNRKLKQRNLFRRITIAPDERLRTAAERIAMLDIEKIDTPEQGRLFERQEYVTAFEISQQHAEAFNVEAVTAAFFEDFKRVFKQLQNELDDQTDDEKWAHDYALQFLSRCLFLYFIQRKRWLGNDTEFLYTFWQAYQDSQQPVNTFVDKWLNVLFFQAFNNRFHGGLTYFPEKIKKILQLAPYLNGGLFRENKLDTEYVAKVPDQLWQNIFTFFEKYNFTIAEDTPLDQEVAVDPEMIGKVYESLVSVEDEERGDAGIFYTPRVEIDLMCRLALVDNLANHIGTKEDKFLFYEALFAFEPEEKEEADAKLANLWQDIYNHLTEITVVDPACGSGSFLVGMLHVLDDLRERAENYLDINVESRFERRKEIIGKNLYGVDVKQWACKVAELRLWLTLIIDAEFTAAELKVRNEPLLPDFSFNIRHGDSIVQDIGGMNLAQTREIESGVPATIKRKITELRNEKLKFYNNDEDRQYSEKEEVHTAENNLFRELLENYDTEISKEIRKLKAWIEDPSEQTTLPGMESSEPQQMSLETVNMQKELERHKENLAQVQRAQEVLSSNTTPPFVWDIAFVEIFNQRKGFDIVIENPPYIRQEDISDLMLPRDEAKTPANKKAYKAKLTRAIYQAFPEYFGYNENRNSVKDKLDAKSDLYVYFYFHGLSLLNSKGSFCTITSNSWLDVGYGRNLQKFLLNWVHLKVVLDNSAKRSFASADVNTVICLISALDKTRESRLQHSTSFVNCTVPFEAILDPIIFYEIETAEGRTRTPEYSIHQISQRELLHEGTREQKYTGDKWGGKYLRAPNIYWYLLENHQDQLIRVGEIAEVRMGLKTGANNFFLLNRETIATWQIEEEFLRPIINSPRDVRNLRVNSAQLPYQLFMCHESRNALRGTSALLYIEYGESQGIHQRPSCRTRQRWYDVGKRPAPPLNFPLVIGSTVRTVYAPDGCYATNNFSEIHTSHQSESLVCFFLNSTLFQLMVNVNGRSSLGGGALTIMIYELEDLLCVNPEFALSEDIDQTVLESEEWDVLDPSPARRKIDNIIFDILELTQGERDGVYEAVHNLVTTRLQKAKSI